MKAKPESLLLIKKKRSIISVITGIDPNLGAVCEWCGALDSPPPQRHQRHATTLHVWAEMLVASEICPIWETHEWWSVADAGEAGWIPLTVPSAR